MNKNNAHEYLPLVQALAEGKIIQCRYQIEDDWYDESQLNFNWPLEYFRIKPEPRIFKLMIHKYTGVIEDNDFISYDENIWEPITVQEIL